MTEDRDTGVPDLIDRAALLGLWNRLVSSEVAAGQKPTVAELRELIDAAPAAEPVPLLDVAEVAAELEALPYSHRWPNMKHPGEWYVRVEDAASMVVERVREAQAGGLQARSTAALTDDPDYFPSNDYEQGYTDGRAAPAAEPVPLTLDALAEALKWALDALDDEAYGHYIDHKAKYRALLAALARPESDVRFTITQLSPENVAVGLTLLGIRTQTSVVDAGEDATALLGAIPVDTQEGT